MFHKTPRLKPLAPLALILLLNPSSSPAQGSLPPSAEARARVARITTCLPPPVLVQGDPTSCTTLAQRMAELHVPGVSIAVLHNGVLEWAQGFGVEAIGGSPVTPDTLFQAGSISKPLAAMAALHQVQLGKLSLDTDINQSLKSWKVPPSDAAPGAIVTLRQILTHTAGFTVHGFPGYAADAPVPTLVQVLNGEKPANTSPIRLESVPGSKFNYSGGGYTVMQQAVLDATGQPFPKVLHDTVLAPIGMDHSTYQQPLPEPLRLHAATPYNADGTPAAGGFHTYPELAAAGLWTTPSDLLRYILEVQHSADGKTNHVLNRDLTVQMLTPGKGSWGLGLEIGGSPANPYFAHGGVNEGFESTFYAYRNTGEAAVVMTNAGGGSRLASALIRSIAVAYNWPDLKPASRTLVKIDPAVLSRYVGEYVIDPAFSITVTLEGDGLVTQAAHQPRIPIFPESETRFFLKVVDAEIEFLPEANGKVNSLVLHQKGQDRKGIRKPPQEAK